MNGLLERLIEIGFSEYEARAYVAALALGTTTGYQVAKESGIPRSAIYEVLNKLTERGAVLTQSFGDQIRYVPVPANQFLNRLQHEFQRNLELLRKELDHIEATEALGNTWNVTGRANLFSFARQMIMEVTAEVLLLVGDDDELDNLLGELQEAHARGVAVTILSPTPYEAADLPVHVHPDEIRLRQAIGHGFVLVCDERQALLADAGQRAEAVWTTNRFTVAWVRWSLRRQASQEDAE